MNSMIDRTNRIRRLNALLHPVPLTSIYRWRWIYRCDTSDI
nr:MAG TPA: hypothetical protein [Caudoviricetes sp.]